MRSADFFATHPVFTHEEYLAAHGARRDRSPRTADSLLTRHAAAGRVLHVRRGLYAAVPVGAAPDTFQVDPFLLATKLAPDAAVAYHAALQFRGKAYSVWHRFAVLTRSHVRPLSFQGSEFVGLRPPRALDGLLDLGGGVVAEQYAGGTVRVTTFERTLVDLLDAPDLGGGWEEVWRSLEMVEYFDLAAVTDHTVRRGSALTTARVGFFLDQHRDALFVEERHLMVLREHAPRQPRYLDRKREPGRLVKPWNLVVPERVIDRFLGGGDVMLSREQLQRAAAESGFQIESYEKVHVLVHLLEAVRSHPFLGPRMALKGGTAINLFVLGLPRLSVDIDLNYVGASDRETMLAERPRIEQALQQVAGRSGLTVKRAPTESTSISCCEHPCGR